jgi:hypothetical protein
VLADHWRVRRHRAPWQAPRGVSRRYRCRRPDDPPLPDMKRPVHAGRLPPWAIAGVSSAHAARLQDP